MFGSGYRIYFGKDGAALLVLLVGGDKASQSRNIRRSQRFWKDYQEEARHGNAKSGLGSRAPRWTPKTGH